MRARKNCLEFKVAIKHVWRDRVTEWVQLEDGQSVPMEVYLLRQVNHISGCVQLLDYYEQADSFVLVFERPAPCRDLFDVITERGALPEYVARNFLRQLVVTLCETHAAGVLHNDVKDENILVELPHGRLRLIDFGAGRPLTSDVYTQYDGRQLSLWHVYFVAYINAIIYHAWLCVWLSVWLFV